MAFGDSSPTLSPTDPFSVGANNRGMPGYSAPDEANLCSGSFFTGVGSAYWLRLEDVRPGVARHLTYLPASLLLRTENADWVLPRDDLPAALPKNIDRMGSVSGASVVRLPVGTVWHGIR